jgi:uncharacterized protein (TIGR03435 family)
MRKSFLAGVILAGLICAAGAAPPPTFEAASIKPSNADSRNSANNTSPGRINFQNVTLKRCLESAYGVPKAQVVGGPEWLDEYRYDIVATAPSGDQDLMPMLQALLADRFKLALHRETRPLRGYALTVGKDGLKMKPSEPETKARTNNSRGSIDAMACPMDHLALKLSAALNAPVADLTQTPGAFDFTLKWTPDEIKTPDADAPPSIFTALQEQLGLRLEARKVPMEVLVIDHVEPPSAN